MYQNFASGCILTVTGQQIGGSYTSFQGVLGDENAFMVDSANGQNFTHIALACNPTRDNVLTFRYQIADASNDAVDFNNSLQCYAGYVPKSINTGTVDLSAVVGTLVPLEVFAGCAAGQAQVLLPKLTTDELYDPDQHIAIVAFGTSSMNGNISVKAYARLHKTAPKYFNPSYS